MFSGFVSRMRGRVLGLVLRYYLTVAHLHEHISLRPRDMIKRSARAGNWATLLVAAIIFPILIFHRGLEFELLFGMLVHLAIFWGIIVGLVLGIQALWICSYFISQRFGPLNHLDFEILDRIFGYGNQEDNVDSELEELVERLAEKERASPSG